MKSHNFGHQNPLKLISQDKLQKFFLHEHAPQIPWIHVPPPCSYYKNPLCCFDHVIVTWVAAFYNYDPTEMHVTQKVTEILWAEEQPWILLQKYHPSVILL